jgi:glutamate formiminotransferase/formiminotetrahydrofolate cyclodeaminase
MPLLELVPNISEGRTPEVVAEVTRAFLRPGVTVLDVDGNRGAHRTVLTLIGEAEALIDAAVAGAEAASRLIDLRVHRGVHVRMGALDVCPFVPLEGVVSGGGMMAEAISAAREAGKRIGALGNPVYMYGEAALSPRRRLLHEVRRRGFEWLAPRMAIDPPDFGPREPHPTAGATAVGARFFLVAFNVNPNTVDVDIAKTIARRIRELGSVKRDETGAIVAITPGRLRGVRATGWLVEDFGCAQVTTNVTDFRITPPHTVFEAIREEAEALGVSVRGSEVIGCIPLEPLRMAAHAAGAAPGASDAELVPVAVVSLGLDAVKPFDPSKKVLEWAIERGHAAASNKS